MSASTIEGVDAKALELGLSEEDLLRLHELMVLTRHLDERSLKLQRSGRIALYASSLGQEAAQVGSAFALKHEDVIVPSYREPGAALARGVRVGKIVSQYFGNSEDLCHGRQIPVHYCFKHHNFLSISSPIGTQIAQAAGLGMAFNIKREPRACLVYFGDGATSSNDFHSGLTFAGVYKAPVIFFCNNNGWAISCSREEQCAAESLADKAKGYGMPGVSVDGNDVAAVWKATREAAERARTGGGPTLIEAVTYRIESHTTSDDARRYRSQEEVEKWRAKDPIARFSAYLRGRGLLDDGREREILEKAKAEVAEAISRNQELDPPPIGSMFEDVYAEMPWHIREQMEELQEEMSKDG